MHLMQLSEENNRNALTAGMPKARGFVNMACSFFPALKESTFVLLSLSSHHNFHIWNIFETAPTADDRCYNLCDHSSQAQTPR
jgi:hypothetical protein